MRRTVRWSMLAAALLAGCAAGEASDEPGVLGVDAAAGPPSGSYAPPASKPPAASRTPQTPNAPPAAEDPCGGIGPAGDCRGDLVVWCAGSRLRTEDCAARRLVCAYNQADARYACAAPQAGEQPPPEQPPAQPPADACAGLDAEGRCEGDVAVWCERGGLTRRDCGAEGSTCGYVAALEGYFCVPPEQPPPEQPPPEQPPPEQPPPEQPPGGIPRPGPADCGGLDYAGRCVGSVAEWCGEAGVERVDCAQWNAPCGYVDDETGYYCQAPPAEQPPPEQPPAEQPPPEQPPADACGGLDARGRCEGDVVVWCDGEALQRIECDVLDQTCAWVDDTLGVDCVDRAGPPPAADPCEGLDFQGRCEGNTAVWCSDGQRYSTDCAERDQTCGWAGEEAGYYCVE